MAFKKWILKHFILAIVLVILISIALYVFISLRFDISDGIIHTLFFIFLMASLFYISMLPTFMTKKPINELLKKGDPEPLLHITSEMLTCKLHKSIELSIKINYCTALRENGRLREAHDALRAIVIDKMALTVPQINFVSQMKFIYYNNLYDICNLLGDDKQANFWLVKALQEYDSMSENQIKKSLRPSYFLLTADKHLRNDDYAQALDAVNQVVALHLPTEMSVALTRAQIYIRINKIDEAKKYLNTVIEKGNKLYCVTIAKNMLAEIEE
ncbi:MAG: hypothetical protein IKU25_08200 [Clostridia bacterium]|nr:hypothetical protein [Clostridia bacterium]